MPDARLKQEHAERAADVLVNSLRHTLDDPSLHERRIDISIERAEDRPYQREKGAERALQFDVAEDLRVEGRLYVRNYGGNVYHVQARVADGEEMRWQLCIPELEATHDALKKHTGNFSKSLLLELERVYGERSMQMRGA